jgi:hypothetical protein
MIETDISPRFGDCIASYPKWRIAGNAATDDKTEEMRMAASALGQKLLVVRAASEDDLAGAFATIVRERAGALILQGDPVLHTRQGRLAVLSARHGIPTMSALR